MHDSCKYSMTNIYYIHFPIVKVMVLWGYNPIGNYRIKSQLRKVLHVALGMSSSGRVCLWPLTGLFLLMILFNHLDAYQSCMLGHSYLASPDYLVIKAWIRATVLCPSFIYLTGTIIHMYVHSCLGLVRY